MVLKYKEIAQDIAHKIANEAFQDKLPSESELMNMYVVSRNTVRNAIDVLYDQGLISRIQGSGYFINQPLHNEDNLMNLANKVGMNALTNEKPVTSKVLDFESRPAGREIAKFLRCDPDETIYYVRRLRWSKDNLLSLEEAYYLRKIVPYLNEKICSQSIFAFIMDNYNIEIVNADEYVKIHHLTQKEATECGRAVNESTLQIEEINYLKNERPFNYSKTAYFQDDLTLYYHISNHLH
ncbi:MAG TPA: GntR family transcriptional regulator [Candidatus Ligilactobacillus excrementavium]|uniref:GntR family transcriptional regulator n=1 Tax=Ligilactobacillus acidipiscis TaxID=89059 RepID=A0A921F8F4_9LACO|nr:GntR family transcriptional regulator [Candidatus Ligilactobacillus excrementavium]HJE97095.1 GntR family transcriptional regulator [Ligilactobacillus acidipiscis]